MNTRIGVVLALSASLAPGQQEAGAGAALPVTRVVLYKNGVGYFEHVGRVRDRQDVAIVFTSGQLNDALKSLTVLDLNGGRIRNVEYGSAAPASRQMEDPRLPLDDKTSLTDVLRSLRGARVEIRNSAAVPGVAGRLLIVDRKVRISASTTIEVDYVSLLAGEGIFEAIRPREKRLLSYAADLALTVGSREEESSGGVTRVRVSRGVMVHESEIQQTKVDSFRNEDSAPRTVLVEHPVRARYTRQLNDQESRLETLGKELESLVARLDEAETRRDRMIEAVTFDKPLA